MSDIPNRDALEAALAAELAKLQKAQMSRLLELMGDPPELANVSEAFWDEVGQELQAVLSPFLQEVYLEQAGALLAEIPIGVDFALVNARAAEWASGYSFELVRGINATSREALQRAVGAFFREGLTIGELEGRITGIFGPVRAEMIATTEITRASVEGERAVVAELEKEGVRMVPFWITNNDEIVKKCPICWPRHEQEITDGVYPPGHPRCRCWTNHELPEVA